MLRKLGHALRAVLVVATTPLAINPVLADTTPPRRGWLENATVEGGKLELKAKLDTGAKTSAVNASDITELQRDGGKWVRFRLADPDEPARGHLVLERDRIAEKWRTGRWDSLVANGPAWHDRFPTMEIEGADPDGFASKDQMAHYFETFAKQIEAPIRTGVEVLSVAWSGTGWRRLAAMGRLPGGSKRSSPRGARRPGGWAGCSTRAGRPVVLLLLARPAARRRSRTRRRWPCVDAPPPSGSRFGSPMAIYPWGVYGSGCGAARGLTARRLGMKVMDHSTLTDNNGRKADFRNVVIIMTTNAGAEALQKTSIGFTTNKQAGDEMGDIKRLFTPEFRNRLDAIISFGALNAEIILRVVDKFLMQLEAQLHEKKVEAIFTDALRAWLAEKGFDPLMGARPMSRLIQDSIAGLGEKLN